MPAEPAPYAVHGARCDMLAKENLWGQPLATVRLYKALQPQKWTPRTTKNSLKFRILPGIHKLLNRLHWTDLFSH